MLSRRALYAGIGIGAAITAAWYAVAGGDDWSGSLAVGLFYAVVVGFVVVVDRVSEWMLVLIWEIDASRTVQARLAVAEERLRFARDFHDVLGRNLTLIAVTSDLAAGLARRGDPDAVDKMLQVRSIAHESAREVREVVTGYRAADLDTELTGARSVLRAAGINTRIIGDSTCIPADAQVAFAWVLREATTNVIRHSNATTCTIELGSHPRTEPGAPSIAVLRIRNDGAPPRDPEHPPGHGLAGLRERMTALGGHLTAGPEPGGWFTVEASTARHHHRAPPLPWTRPRDPAAARRRRAPHPHRPGRPARPAGRPRRGRAGRLRPRGRRDGPPVPPRCRRAGPADARPGRHRRRRTTPHQLPDCATLIVTSHGRPGHLKRALSAGVRGFLPKTVSAQVLADVVRTVHAGGRYVDPQLAAEAISTGDNPLTSRETDVLELAAAGTPIEDIARQAALSPGTVRNYLSSAATKLGAANRHDAAQRARAHGWI